MGGFIPDQRFLLRWRFEYNDKAPKYGMWGDSGHGVEAWNQPRNGMTRAQIEAKDIISRETKIIVDCPACDYRLFQWIAIQRLNPKSQGLLQKNVGLCLWTNDQKIEAYEWGEVVQKPLINGEKNIHFATDGR